jgi:adenylosuccinate synthase
MAKVALMEDANAAPIDGVRNADVIVGIQWGDEGKGRVVDYYADRYDVIARFGGGDNAGHTIVVGDRKLALRIVPSGVLQARPQLFVGGGTVVSLAGLAQELDMLAKVGVDVARVKVSDRAQIVFPYHVALDRASENARGAAAIGTTGRGIGPAYTDRVARAGITFADLRDARLLGERIRRNLSLHEPVLARMESRPRDEDVIAETLDLRQRILPHVVDGVEFIHGALEGGRRVLIEGAQGTMLDIGYGTYPFVTSSHTIAGGACTGLGIGPRAIGAVVGVAKAYCTRVGAGPFPSELHDAIGERIREQGGEFGTVTGRPRRCGWFDAVAARYAARLNGLGSLIITKLDVLTGLERIGIVSGYERAGKSVGVEAMPPPELHSQIEWHDGWNEDLSGVRRVADLPRNARRYVRALQASVGVRIDAVSIGPERSALALA